MAILVKSHTIPKTKFELKQCVMRENNQIYKDIFDRGVEEQQVSIYENKILLVAKHRRGPILKIIEESGSYLTSIVNQLLINKAKERLIDVLRNRYGLGVDLILKDYNPISEISGTFVILDKDVNHYVTD